MKLTQKYSSAVINCHVSTRYRKRRVQLPEAVSLERGFFFIARPQRVFPFIWLKLQRQKYSCNATGISLQYREHILRREKNNQNTVCPKPFGRQEVIF